MEECGAGAESMGRKRRLKQQKRKNERVKEEFEIFPTIEYMLNEDMIPDR